MKVKELIEELKKYDEDLIAVYKVEETGLETAEWIEIQDCTPRYRRHCYGGVYDADCLCDQTTGKPKNNNVLILE